jgi:hypothetical protein
LEEFVASISKANKVQNATSDDLAIEMLQALSRALTGNNEPPEQSEDEAGNP